MKTSIKKIALLSLTASFVLFISCKKDDDANNQNDEPFESANLTSVSKADNIFQASFNIVENGYVEKAEQTNQSNQSLFPICTTITLTTNGNGGTIVLDFGSGCVLANGAAVSGKINITYSAINQGQRTITYVYDNFEYNGNSVSGDGTVIRILSNNNGNPQSLVDEDISVNLGGGVSATRNSQTSIEWVEGVTSGNWMDNVYHVDGTWTTVLNNGFQRQGEVLESLVRKLNCQYGLVSGRLQIIQQGQTGVLDFGEGACDNVATFEFAGQTYTIIFG